MAKVIVRARLHPSYNKKLKSNLRIEGVLEGTLIPNEGEGWSVELPLSLPFGLQRCRRYRFMIENRELFWLKDGGEHYEIDAFLIRFEELKHLAILHEWKVLEGLTELSVDQQSFLLCQQNACGHDHTSAL